jgi:hypothetical protein
MSVSRVDSESAVISLPRTLRFPSATLASPKFNNMSKNGFFDLSVRFRSIASVR